MSEKDIAEKTFIALDDVFADIVNGLLFEGKQIIMANSLEDITLTSQYKADEEILHEQERDTYKLWRGHGVNLILIGMENQTKPDKDMPFRVIGYDGAAYRTQLLKTEERIIKGKVRQVVKKERYPVVTLVLYFGQKRWRYSKSLKESFYPALPNDEVTQVLQQYISDYKINVFEISYLKPEQVKLFRSDFRIVADYFVNSKNNVNYIPDDKVIDHVDEFLKLMSVLTGDRKYEEIGTSFEMQEKKEGSRMCKVLEAREQRGEQRGIEIGTLQTLLGLVKDNLLSVEVAAQRANMSVEEFERRTSNPPSSNA